MNPANSDLQLSPVGRALIQGYEKLRFVAYFDERGVLTIGWGHTGKEVIQGLVWTKQQADTAFEEDVAWAEHFIIKVVTAALNQNQFDALVSFVFNVGINAFDTSTMLHLLNAEDMIGASFQFTKWIYAGKHISQGLIDRRSKERALFDTLIAGVTG